MMHKRLFLGLVLFWSVYLGFAIAGAHQVQADRPAWLYSFKDPR